MKFINLLILLYLIIITGCINSKGEKNININTSSPDSGIVVIDGTELDYVVEGKGRPAIVIGSSVYYPRTFSKLLRDHLQLYFVDMRWFAENYSPVKSEDYTLQTLTDDIEKIRQELNLEKIIIIGHSIHGAIAFEYAKRYPERVSHIIMIGSPNYQSNIEQENAINEIWETASAERKTLQNRNWEKLSKMKDLSPAQFEIENYCLMSPKYWYDPEYDARWLWEGMTMNTDILFHIYNGIFADYYMFEKERKVPAPTFVALGRYDYVDPYTLWNGHGDIKDLTIRIFEKSGHTPQLEEPEQFDNEILKWIKEN